MERDIKLFLLAYAMVMCVENPKKAVKRPVELISELKDKGESVFKCLLIILATNYTLHTGYQVLIVF